MSATITIDPATAAAMEAALAAYRSANDSPVRESKPVEDAKPKAAKRGKAKGPKAVEEPKPSKPAKRTKAPKAAADSAPAPVSFPLGKHGLPKAETAVSLELRTSKRGTKYVVLVTGDRKLPVYMGSRQQFYAVWAALCSTECEPAFKALCKTGW